MQSAGSDIILAYVTGESIFGKNTRSHAYPTRKQIAELAYEFYTRRGRADGGDVDDWLRAERELRLHFA